MTDPYHFDRNVVKLLQNHHHTRDGVSNTHPNPVTSTPLDGIGWPHHFGTQDCNFGGQGNEFGSQGSEFGGQGGSQDVVEEWLKEDEHTRV